MALPIKTYRPCYISTVRQLVHSGSNANQWYGVRIDDSNSSPDVARIGNLSLHASLPVHSTMKGCLLNDNGTVNYYLDPADWTKKVGGVASNLDGTDGQVMVEVGPYWRRVDVISGTVRDIKISIFPISGGQYVPKFYVGAYKAAIQRSNSKLASVVNITADYRGGNNNAAWDAADNTLLGKPASSVSLKNFRTYARNRYAGYNWNVTPYRQSMLLYELFMIEYATRNSQKAVNVTLTAQGFKQGGLGAGVTTAVSAEWNTFSSYYPFIACGSSNSIGNGSGEVSVVVPNFGGAGVNRTFTVPRYRGIENFFGDIWEYQDGASVFHEAAGGVSKFYTCDLPQNFADGTATNYDYRADLPTTSSYVKLMNHDEKGIMIPKDSTGGSVTYYCDYFYTPGLVNAWRAILRGGAADSGAAAGFGYSNADNSAAATSAYFGARLCYLT